MIIRTIGPPTASTDPFGDWPWPPSIEPPDPPDGDGPAALEYRQLVAEQAADLHPAVAAVVAAAQVEHRRRTRRRTTGLRVVS